MPIYYIWGELPMFQEAIPFNAQLPRKPLATR